VVDEIVPGDELRRQLEQRLAFYVETQQVGCQRKHGVLPV
jgi:acetyl-CoA carboxylase carboxyltransferase component